MSGAPDPGPLMQMSTGYWPSQVLLTTNRIGLFEHLADQASTAAEVATALQLAPRPARLLLDACVALELLERDGETYRCSTLAKTFLVPGSPGYMGNTIRYADNLYATWGELGRALREDRPPMPAETYLGEDPGQTRDFVYAMHDRALGIGHALAGLVDLGEAETLLDVGGGPGTYSALLAARHPRLRATVMELPAVAAIAAEILQTMDAGDRVTATAGDYHRDEFPAGFDAVLISGVFHRETAEYCQGMIARAFEALNPGGMLVVSDVFTDASHCAPAFATLFGLNMMLTAPHGGVHADAEVEQWMRDAGFGQTTMQPFPPPMPHRVVTGVRP